MNTWHSIDQSKQLCRSLVGNDGNRTQYIRQRTLNREYVGVVKVSQGCVVCTNDSKRASASRCSVNDHRRVANVSIRRCNRYRVDIPYKNTSNGAICFAFVQCMRSIHNKTGRLLLRRKLTSRPVLLVLLTVLSIDVLARVEYAKTFSTIRSLYDKTSNELYRVTCSQCCCITISNFILGQTLIVRS